MNQTLNKSIKEKIIDNALAKAGIPQRKKALRDARADWAERVRLAAIGGPETEAEVLKTEKKIAALIAKLPEELRTNHTFVRYDSDIYLNLAGSRVSAYFNGNYRSYEQGEPDPIRKIAPCEYTLLADDPLVTEFYGFDALYREIKSDEADIHDDRLWIEQKKTGRKITMPLHISAPETGLVLSDIVDVCKKTYSGCETIIATRSGGQLQVGTISRAFAKARDKTGIKWEGDPPSFHEIRSLSARLYAKAKGAEYAQGVLGHKSAQTSEVYIDSRGSQWEEIEF